MPNYKDALEYLESYNIDPVMIDALAWSSIIGGIGSFADDKQYLEHFTEDKYDDGVREFFSNLVSHNSSLLDDDDIHLLLPDDDSPMKDRLNSVATWCETFISSLGISEQLKNNNLESRVNNHLGDLVEISRMDSSFSQDYDNLEQAEIDYMELYEFLRVTLLTLELEFKSFAEG